nr:nitrilase-related carbon-nitrogen hydrolase [Peteryoungia desertarenae]
MGTSLWIAAAASFVLVHTLLWTRQNGWAKPGRYLLILLITALPPFGITGWAHPLTAAGIVFPGWGWWGLLAATAALMALVTRFGAATAIVLSALWFWSAIVGSEAITNKAWSGLDVRMGASLGRDTSLQRQKDLTEIATQAGGSGATIVVLPESTLGVWTPTIERISA